MPQKRSEAAQEYLIVALDFNNLKEAQKLVRRLGNLVLWYKVGLELFFASRGDIISFLKKKKKKIFLDLKLNDIPATVERACRVLAGYECDLLSVFGTEATVRAACAGLMGSPTRVVNVSVLTSEEGGAGTGGVVLRRALETRQAGGVGVVCSAKENPRLRQRLPPSFLIINPGIRLLGMPADDQRRVATPGDALRTGANHIVVGRPITRSNCPEQVVQEIHNELSCAL
ncbi:MAG: orotidine-5'-phosphate decarboxylase [Leptospiraceae bacterium]|nr:orotidine-5'-phosphate decarboxylase [Leptospiraceae bacterium]MDW8307435.1 orotidine-5'-phosphate decarboxylase [Leptospiraceae bacterium]